MADAIATPQVTTLSNATLATLETAVNTEVQTLLVAGARNLQIMPLITATVGSTLTYFQSINYIQFIVPGGS